MMNEKLARRSSPSWFDKTSKSLMFNIGLHCCCIIVYVALDEIQKHDLAKHTISIATRTSPSEHHKKTLVNSLLSYDCAC
jgi:hypothetical protein